MSQVLLPPMDLSEPILQNQMVKPSEILRLISMEKRYKWITGNIDQGDGIHRCALGAIYGYFGWNGFHGEGIDRTLKECIEKTVDIFGGDPQELGMLADYNNSGNNYKKCADWLEARGY